jgi:hypothetical protein
VNQYEEPGFSKDRYNCPHCEAYAQMVWYIKHTTAEGGTSRPVPGIFFVFCVSCGKYQIWQTRSAAEIATERVMIYPDTKISPLPSADMPDDAKGVYEEAREICGKSPRAATALLRMCVEVICRSLGDEKKSLNENIGILVSEGLLAHVQQALDALRVIGNHAVHPGQIDKDDTAEIAHSLFPLINIIVDQMVTQPKLAEAIYDTIPQGAKEAIEKRDENKSQ